MTSREISILRLRNQQVLGSGFNKAADLIGWMGAMQAQDYAMVKWAAGLRVNNATEDTIQKSIDDGDILRTHVLRPTWHLVTAQDIYPWLQLTAGRIKNSMKSRDRQLELDETVFRKTNSIIEKSLAFGNHLTRDELIAILEAQHIRTNDNRASHIFERAELEGIICSGKSKGNKPTYALLAERVPVRKDFTRDEALARLVTAYFTSHGPATLGDFTWWSGLAAGEARHALEMIKPGLHSFTIHNDTCWFTGADNLPDNADPIQMLPAFDEFLVSYKNRTATLSPEIHSNAVSNNGIFRPVIVIGGQVRGIWKRTGKNNRIILETTFFEPWPAPAEKTVREAFQPFINFMGREAGTGCIVLSA